MNRRIRKAGAAGLGLSVLAASLAVVPSTVASADVLHDYEGETEGFKGETWTHMGVTFRDINQVNGFFPDGAPMTPADLGTHAVIEQADLLYVDLPDYGSPVNSLTFGGAFIGGPNLTVGAMASVWMDLAEPASAASFDIAYYENGPWGNIVYHLDALLNGQVVASDSFVISDLGGRDNITFDTMAVAAGGAGFDQLHVYARLNGSFTGPRGMIDDLRLTAVPEPSLAAVAAAGALAAVTARRRRRP
jgi:hypothetical protein